MIKCVLDILLSSFYFSVGIFLLYLMKFLYQTKINNFDVEESYHMNKNAFIYDMLHMWIPGAIVSAVVKHL